MTAVTGKVLFLDVDGVLNCYRSVMAFGNGSRIFDPSRVRLVEKLVRKSSAAIVWSTSWRGEAGGHYPEWACHLHDVLSATPLTDDRFWRDHLRTPLATPRIAGASRGVEINRWLADTGISRDQVVILDDDEEMAPLCDRFVRTSYLHGFGAEEYKRACELFRVEP